MQFSQYYALGAQLDREGRYDEAFVAYSRANALQRRPDEAAKAEAEEVAALDEIGQYFSPQFFRQNYGGDKVNAPIFIVGMPRTGTTLIEQILDSHPLVKGMGETDALQKAVAG